MPTIPDLQIFDPREHQDYRFAISPRKTLSAADLGMLVLLYNPPARSKSLAHPPSLSCGALDEFTIACLTALGGLGFSTQSPLTKIVREQPAEAAITRQEAAGTSISYFNPDAVSVQNHLEMRRRLVTYEEWIIGSCVTQFCQPRQSKRWYEAVAQWDFEHIWSDPSNVLFLSLFVGETGELMLFSSIFPGIDAALKKLHDDANDHPLRRE